MKKSACGRLAKRLSWLPVCRAAVPICLALISSCSYFDPLNPSHVDPAYARNTWERHLGGNGTSAGYSVQQTADGGFVLFGSTDEGTAGRSDLWVCRTDASGTPLWSKTFGGPGDDVGRSGKQTADGGYVVVGSKTAASQDIYLVRTDSDGTWLWERTFDGGSEDSGYSLTLTSGGGYAIAGWVSVTGGANACLITTDAEGNNGKRTTFAINQSIAYCVQQTADGGYILAGSAQPNTAGDDDALLLKTDAAGAVQWTRFFGRQSPSDFPEEYLECAAGVRQTSDGGYILCGFTNSLGAGYGDAWLIRTDSQGIELWSRTLGGSYYDRADCVEMTPDGGFVLAGMTRSFAGFDQAWLIKTGSDGVPQWSRAFGGSGSEGGYCVSPTADGGYIMTGSTTSFQPGGSDGYLVYYKPE